MPLGQGVIHSASRYLACCADQSFPGSYAKVLWRPEAGRKERGFGLIACTCSLQVIALCGLLLEGLEGDAGFEEGVHIVERCFHVLVSMDAFDAAWFFLSGRSVANRQGRWKLRKGLRCWVQKALKRSVWCWGMWA